MASYIQHSRMLGWLCIGLTAWLCGYWHILVGEKQLYEDKLRGLK